MRAAEVRFYIDADIFGLAHILAPLRPDFTYPGDPGAQVHKRIRPPCVVSDKAMSDTSWLPIVAHQGWLIITRDHNIRENPAERQAVRECGAKMVALAGADARTKWLQLELFMRRWRRIEALVHEQGPFIYLASTSKFFAWDLDR